MAGIQVTREQRRALARENAKRPLVLREIPRHEWPVAAPPHLARALRSRHFLVQVFEEPEPDNAGIVRLSVNRTELTGDRWTDNITWDDLQRLKREAGYGDFDAVEVYPPDRDVVNVANMRHLWVLPYPLHFAWRNKA